MADDQVTAIIKVLEGFVEKIVKQVTLDTTAYLRQTTPVDTGWARANWVPKIGSPSTSPIGTYDQAKKGFVNSGPQNAGEVAVAGSYKIALGNVYVSNNVPYIGKLNDGHSKQAPALFVERAIEQAVANIQNIRP